MTSLNSGGPVRSPSPKEDGLAQLSRSTENARRIKNVQDKFVNSQNLQREGRALVGEGILMKICRKKPKQRAFFLFNDILVYGRVVISGRRYSQQKIIPLNEIQISAPMDSPENPYAWLISSPKKSFVVRANSDRERQEWLTHLERCIRSASGGSNFQRNAVAAHWVPDDKADACMHCHTSKFSAYNRRHKISCLEVSALEGRRGQQSDLRRKSDRQSKNRAPQNNSYSKNFLFPTHCRNCGFIICDSCSKRRFLLLHLDPKPVRVCDTCYTKLSSNNASDPRSQQRDRTADSSDSDGDDSAQQYSPIPATFYQNVENL